MRKWVGVVGGIVIVAAAGYLGAQAYSSQRFDSEIDELVSRLDASPDWQVSRDDVDSGWFHSSGRIEARYLEAAQNTDPVVVEVPYEASHGLLETTLNGEVQIRGSEGEALFGEVIESEGPVTWTGRFLTREQKLQAHFMLPSFSQTVSVPAQQVAGETTAPRDMQLDFAGLTLDLEQVDDKVTFNGEAPRLQMADDQADILVEGTSLSGAFEGNEKAFHQAMSLTIPTTTVTPNGNPAVVSKDVSYAVEATLDAEQLAMQLQMKMGETRVQDQSVFDGGFALTLDHVDGDAYRSLVAALDEHLTDIQSAIDADDDQQLQSALQPLRPSIKAVLAGSPHLSLDSLTANSPVLGMKMRGSGELGIDGDGIESWDLDTMNVETLQRVLLPRLEGRLTLEGAPAMMLMALGLPMSRDPLQVELADGVLQLNGQRMPLLPPTSASE
ncbi:DUF945 family protein [Salinicola socius]|uniref:DUF945 domain-containing protein n=1 Tax=Salinicola socius TaxID=404433 RepID=A0A1Q8SNU2_9GAMM|nr:DUF945 family protein [Salinicola socius]OLO03082.1 hypothetical protein BTW07_16225 [Salinicola socius]